MRERKVGTQRSRKKNARVAKEGLRLVLTLLLVGVSVAARAAAPSEVRKVIYDQDTDGIIGGNEDPLVMLLQSPNIQVLGVTVVTGNGWLKQETADVLKLLEDLHRTDMPVIMGSEFPLVQSRYTPCLLYTSPSPRD